MTADAAGQKLAGLQEVGHAKQSEQLSTLTVQMSTMMEQLQAVKEETKKMGKIIEEKDKTPVTSASTASPTTANLVQAESLPHDETSPTTYDT